MNQSLKDIDITLENVQSILHNLDLSIPEHREHLGEKELPAIFYKKTSSAMKKPVSMLLQMSLDSGDIPSDWLNLIIEPTFTKGDRTNIKTYRPICSTPVFLNVMEQILSSQIIHHLEINNLLSNHCSLLSNKSYLCNSQVVMEEQYPVDVIYLEWRNAFVDIKHDVLISKLRSYYISGKVLKWIEMFVKNRSLRTSANGVLSDPFTLSNGFPLGSRLGHLLYLIFIDDLFDGIQSGGYLQADCCILDRSIKSPNDRIILQNDLERVQKWCNTWSMHFDISKCKIKHIGKSNPKYDYRMYKCLIEKYEN